MSDTQIAAEATKAVGYAGLGGLMLKAIELLVKQFGVSRSAHSTDMERTIKMAADMREELRKDNEAMRVRMRDLEERMNSLERELHDAHIANGALKMENSLLRARLGGAS